MEEGKKKTFKKIWGNVGKGQEYSQEYRTVCFHSSDTVTDKTTGGPSAEQDLPVQPCCDR